MAASHLPAGQGAGSRGRSRGRGDHQAHPAAVLYARGNVCSLLAAKAWVNVFLYDGAMVPDPHGIITSGHDNKTAGTVAIRQGEKVDAPAFEAMFKQIIANNKAGGWRKLKLEADKSAGRE